MDWKKRFKIVTKEPKIDESPKTETYEKEALEKAVEIAENIVKEIQEKPTFNVVSPKDL